MLSWILEGSNDMNNWFMIDERVHSEHTAAALETLMVAGKFSTWGTSNLEEFNSFRII
jgi:predicted oxidoreductase